MLGSKESFEKRKVRIIKKSIPDTIKDAFRYKNLNLKWNPTLWRSKGDTISLRRVGNARTKERRKQTVPEERMRKTSLELLTTLMIESRVKNPPRIDTDRIKIVHKDILKRNHLTIFFLTTNLLRVNGKKAYFVRLKNRTRVIGKNQKDGFLMSFISSIVPIIPPK